jgi:putative nucleotidyltransferase with HDIG domain
MTKALPRSKYGQLYLGTVIFAGSAIAVLSVKNVFARGVSTDWAVLAALTLLTGSFTVRIPGVLARISVSDAFVFASVLLFGPDVATVITAIDSIVATLWMRPEHRSLFRSLFNLATVSLSIWTASNAFFWFAGATPGSTLPLSHLVGPLFMLAALYFLINSWLVAFALSYERDAPVVGLWWDNFPWLSLNYFGGVSVAALLVSHTRSVDASTIGIILPLLIITYLTYRSSLARLADAQRHVTQVNDLYLSTIETLAMAVDAKDQITHGHIRRVQVYAVELAKRVGVQNEQQLRAIEAAALLHDMGKLAIPEHILNKPGKLTVAEFETMKTHSDIGADLLSSIRFPYPVVPIVRHHHESWNGTGYPAGISGTDIPLGARILAVVDCFDALNSDRPYRPRLEPEEAFEILRERSGTMYDPLVVATFIKAYEELAPLADSAGQQARTLVDTRDVVNKLPVSTPFEEIRATAAESAALIATRQHVAEAKNSAEAMSIIAQCARQLTPTTVCTYYEYSPERDELTCILASGGDNNKPLLGVTIRPGERVTGWVAANRRTISNSDAALDLGQTALLIQPELRSTISTPVTVNDQSELHGVLTGYSPKDVPFSHRHVYAFEQLADTLGHYFSRAHRPGRLFVVTQKHG